MPLAPLLLPAGAGTGRCYRGAHPGAQARAGCAPSQPAPSGRRLRRAPPYGAGLAHALRAGAWPPWPKGRGPTGPESGTRPPKKREGLGRRSRPAGAAARPTALARTWPAREPTHAQARRLPRRLGRETRPPAAVAACPPQRAARHQAEQDGQLAGYGVAEVRFSRPAPLPYAGG
jgi:hypothetical protein